VTHGGAAFRAEADAVFDEDARRGFCGQFGSDARELAGVERVEFAGFLVAPEQRTKQLHAGRGVADRVLAEVDEGDGDTGFLQAFQRGGVVRRRAVAFEAEDREIGAQCDGLFDAEAVAGGATNAHDARDVREARAVLCIACGVELFPFAQHPGDAAQRIAAFQDRQRGHEAAFAEQDALDPGRHGDAAAGHIDDGLRQHRQAGQPGNQEQQRARHQNFHDRSRRKSRPGSA
jgi:hypothetical protein